MSRRLWLTWTALTGVGWALGIGIGLALGAPIGVLVGMMLVTPVVTGLAGGLLGTVQWLALRRRLRKAGWWIPASAVGLALGLTSSIVLVEQLGRLLAGRPVNVAELTSVQRATSFAAIGAVTGLFLGIMQSLALRQSPRRGHLWGLTTALALTVAMVGASILADLAFGGVTRPLGFGVFLLFTGVVFGAITGYRLRILLTPAVP